MKHFFGNSSFTIFDLTPKVGHRFIGGVLAECGYVGMYFISLCKIYLYILTYRPTNSEKSKEEEKKKEEQRRKSGHRPKERNFLTQNKN